MGPSPVWRAAGASLGHSAVDVGDGQPEPGDRTLGDQRRPSRQGRAPSRRWSAPPRPGPRRRRLDPRVRHPLGRAADAVVDHHDGDGGAADDVELLAGRCRLQHVLARESGDQGLDLLGRDADQDDRLVMLDQLGAGDHAVRVDPDRDPDRLARVADGVDHVRVEEHPAFQLGAGVGRGSRWGALDRAQTIGAGDQRRTPRARAGTARAAPRRPRAAPADPANKSTASTSWPIRPATDLLASGKEARSLFHPDLCSA